MQNRRYQRLKHCEICLERKRKGISCSKQHFICSICFSRYLRFKCESDGSVVDNKFLLRCPIPNCVQNRPWGTKSIIGIADSETLNYCMEAHDVNSTRSKAKTVNISLTMTSKLIEALNIYCPVNNCHRVLDPTPDGCAAMSCPYCKVNFCWICFQTYTSSTLCHLHVSRCPFVPIKERGNLFVKQSIVNEAHRLHRLQQLRCTLYKHCCGHENDIVSQTYPHYKTDPCKSLFCALRPYSSPSILDDIVENVEKMQSLSVASTKTPTKNPKFSVVLSALKQHDIDMEHVLYENIDDSVIIQSVCSSNHKCNCYGDLPEEDHTNYSIWDMDGCTVGYNTRQTVAYILVCIFVTLLACIFIGCAHELISNILTIYREHYA